MKENKMSNFSIVRKDIATNDLQLLREGKKIFRICQIMCRDSANGTLRNYCEYISSYCSTFIKFKLTRQLFHGNDVGLRHSEILICSGS